MSDPIQIPDGPVPPCYIYALRDPLTGEIRYVGKSDVPKRRLSQHLIAARKQTDHKACWIRSLLARGVKPTLEIIDEASPECWEALEAAYIEFYKEAGLRLVNVNPGGNGAGRGKDHPAFGRKPTPEQLARQRKGFTKDIRARMSAAHRGKDFVSHEGREKLRQINALRRRTPEEKARISAAQRGKPKSPETKEKIRATLTGRKASPETRAKLSLVHKGRVCAAETRRKIGAAFSAERKNDLRARLKGKSRSLEVRLKIIATKQRGQLQLPL